MGIVAWRDPSPDGQVANGKDRLRLGISGQVTVAEAEELYLNASTPEVIQLLQRPLSNEELGRHPLLVMFRRHGSRGWEDSLL